MNSLRISIKLISGESFEGLRKSSRNFASMIKFRSAVEQCGTFQGAAFDITTNPDPPQDISFYAAFFSFFSEKWNVLQLRGLLGARLLAEDDNNLFTFCAPTRPKPFRGCS